jgi:hypothetical protein
VKKIPTLFMRDPDDMKHVLPEVHPECQWVLDGEGIATRKYDGTCVLIEADGDGAIKAFARREVKRGTQPPPNFTEVERDPNTGKAVGWEPAEQSGFWKYIDEAIRAKLKQFNLLMPGTYELCGPKINGNPEGFNRHILVKHEEAERVDLDLGGMAPEQAFLECYDLLTDSFPYEGIVWHHPDGRMAKLKVRDFV